MKKRVIDIVTWPYVAIVDAVAMNDVDAVICDASMRQAYYELTLFIKGGQQVHSTVYMRDSLDRLKNTLWRMEDKRQRARVCRLALEITNRFKSVQSKLWVSNKDKYHLAVRFTCKELDCLVDQIAKDIEGETDAVFKYMEALNSFREDKELDRDMEAITSLPDTRCEGDSIPSHTESGCYGRSSPLDAWEKITLPVRRNKSDGSDWS